MSGKLRLVLVLTIIFCLILNPMKVQAQADILGIHLLSPSEISAARDLLSTKDGGVHYVTVPFTFDDLNHRDRWQAFLRDAKTANLKPLLRLTTRFEAGSWVVPTRSDIMKMAKFLSSLDWQTDELPIILFNEPNHAKEWGGRLDPEEYARISEFAIDWFKTEPKKYLLLPAGLDLAAPTGKETLEAFSYWQRALTEVPQLFEKLDGWTSHSYPNPGFVSDPWKTDKRSLRGYQHELTFISRYTSKQLPVYITETGWNNEAFSVKQMQWYYQVAYKNIWNSDPRIKAVTPFLLQGAPGTFAPFSFLDALGKPTKAYAAYQNILGIDD